MESKPQPQAVEIEEAVLGALLIEKDAILDVMDIISPNSFYNTKHSMIFEAIITLNNSSEPIDLMTIVNQLKNTGKLTTIGGSYYLSQLTNRVSSSANIVSHCMILKQMEIRRSAINLGAKMMEEGYDDSTQAPDLMNYILDEAYKINSFSGGQRLKTNAELIRDDKIKIEFANTNKGITGQQTGIDNIDNLFGGYQDSDLIIKAARPGMGKTSQMLSEASNMVIEHNATAYIVSIEMTARQLMRKLISIDAEIDLKQMNEGEMTKEDWSRYNNTASKYIDSGLIIDDKTKTLNGIRKEAKKLSMKGKLDIVFIDYLQLINHKVSQGRSKENEVSEISKSLKQLAKEIDVPIVCLSQLSRAVEIRGGEKIPILSDLRDSGSIEQDADIVQFLYRPEYYDISEDAEGNSTHQVAYMIVSKHRNGTTKDVKMRFIGNFTKFTNWTEEPFSPQKFGIDMPVSEEFEVKKIKDDDVPF